MTYRLILASGSPRRSLLLSTAGFNFEVRIPEVDESILDDEPATEAVLRISGLKAAAGDRQAGDVILAADTMVVSATEPLGKPSDHADAVRMLTSLSGQTHSVLTGWTIIADAGERFGVSESRVTFKELTEDAIGRYVADAEPFDKAGAYGIQGENGRLIESVTGSRANVMGLPLRDVVDALESVGVLRSTPER